MTTTPPPLPDFHRPEPLLAHIRHTLAFYDGRCRDDSGGFFHFYKDDGTVYDRRTRHLVSSTRFVFTQAMAFRRFGEPRYQESTRHALRFLQQAHLQPNGGYAWQLDWDGTKATVQDGTNHCYGLAFVVLAHAHALMAGIEEARAGLDTSFALMEQRFWEPSRGLYADEADAAWQVGSYRGQNANMHSCEAMIAAFDATKDAKYLQRALTLAESITQRQAALADTPDGPLVWEHYRADWSVDWDYNRDDKTNIFRPWGFQTGHLTEWAKLLLQLETHLPAASSTPRGGAAGTRRTAGWSTASRRTAACATATSTSGCRPRAWPLPRCSRCAPATPATGAGTTSCGPTAGRT
jgi:mannose/cellobiose epimerase-like protein (N-acyl-D-glucosamine 2-epimerase family)